MCAGDKITERKKNKNSMVSRKRPDSHSSKGSPRGPHPPNVPALAQPTTKSNQRPRGRGRQGSGRAPGTGPVVGHTSPPLLHLHHKRVPLLQNTEQIPPAARSPSSHACVLLTALSNPTTSSSLNADAIEHCAPVNTPTRWAPCCVCVCPSATVGTTEQQGREETAGWPSSSACPSQTS